MIARNSTRWYPLDLTIHSLGIEQEYKERRNRSRIQSEDLALIALKRTRSKHKEKEIVQNLLSKPPVGQDVG